MFSHQPSNSGAAVATGPISEPINLPVGPARSMPGIRPLAPVGGHPQPASKPLPQAVPAPSLIAAQPTGPVQSRTTVFPPGNGNSPQSPWAVPGARLAVKAQPSGARPAFGRPAVTPATDDLEELRKLVLGHHLAEVQTKVAELQLSLGGEIKRLRNALMERVDEMSGYLHKDMVILREEMHREVDLMKTDLFAAATGLSSVKDRLGGIEQKSREQTEAAIAQVDERLSRVAGEFQTSLAQLEQRMKNNIDTRCADALEAMVRKTEMAGLLADFSVLLCKEPPSDPGLAWFSAPPPPAAKSPSPPSSAADWSATGVPPGRKLDTAA